MHTIRADVLGNSRLVSRVVTALLLMTLLAVNAPPAAAAVTPVTIVVNSVNDDEVNDDNDCTLREAIRSANEHVFNGLPGECAMGTVGPDIITFDPTVFLTDVTIAPTSPLHPSGSQSGSPASFSISTIQ